MFVGGDWVGERQKEELGWGAPRSGLSASAEDKPRETQGPAGGRAYAGKTKLIPQGPPSATSPKPCRAQGTRQEGWQLHLWAPNHKRWQLALSGSKENNNVLCLLRL